MDRNGDRCAQGDVRGGRAWAEDGPGMPQWGLSGQHRWARWHTVYLGDEVVQTQLVLGEALVEGAQLGQGVPQRGLLCPQLGH